LKRTRERELTESLAKQRLFQLQAERILKSAYNESFLREDGSAWAGGIAQVDSIAMPESEELSDHDMSACYLLHPGLSHADYLRRIKGEEPEEEETNELDATHPGLRCDQAHAGKTHSEWQKSGDEEESEEEKLTPRGVPYRQSNVNESPHLQVLGQTPATRYWLRKMGPGLNKVLGERRLAESPGPNLPQIHVRESRAVQGLEKEKIEQRDYWISQAAKMKLPDWMTSGDIWAKSAVSSLGGVMNQGHELWMRSYGHSILSKLGKKSAKRRQS